ncbi:MAG TPA: hypothetical protein V6C96_00585, partial [Vampirovibrionales bacterium]
AVGGVGLLSVLYLANFTFGGLEFLPDALPILGNLDEITATVILLSALKYFDIDVMEMFSGKSDELKDNPEAPEPRYEGPKN